MDFCSSSHRNKWIISEDKLVCASKMVHLRHDPAFSDDLKFATAQGLLQKALREETNQKGIDYVIALRKEHGLPTDNLSPVSTEEEYLYSSYYTRMLAKGKKKWPPKVLATAITFVKRFFLHHSCMEHEVIKIVFTCLYIAGKVRCLSLELRLPGSKFTFTSSLTFSRFCVTVEAVKPSGSVN